MLFTKMQGTGNDFVIINNIQNNIKYAYSKLSEYLCNRHFGVGADGVIYVEKSDVADFKMRIFNSDGTEAEMCGNGIRCFAKYLYINDITNKDEIDIETLAGIKNVKLVFEGKRISSVEVNMGKPCLDFEKIPVYYNQNQYIVIEEKKYYPISMGNPHCVCFVDNIEDIDIQKEGEKIENYKYFPNKTNVEFVQIISNNEIKVRVWERGVGETLACGTGACASAVISNKYKNLDNNIKADLKGGSLEINYDVINENVYLKGEAEVIYEGKISI